MIRNVLPVALLLAACGSDLPPPRIISVAPATLLASDATEIVVSVEGVLPYHVNFDQGMVSADTTATLSVGGREFATGGYRADGTVRAFLPSVFSPGAHDVAVRFSDARSATARSALTIGPGNWPDAYVIDPIPEQVAGAPFDVTIRAQRGGSLFSAFFGTVGLATDRGRDLSPELTQPFDAGLVTERSVVIATPGNVSIVVTDANGTTASSNNFLVRAP